MPASELPIGPPVAVVEWLPMTVCLVATVPFSRYIGCAIHMSSALKAGTVWVNTYRAVSYMMPFSGMKRSGIGRESGIEAIREYLKTKSVWISIGGDVPANPFILR